MTNIEKVRNHLLTRGHLTAVEAQTVYRIRWAATPIHYLRKAGMDIVSEERKDATGQRYVRWYLRSQGTAVVKGQTLKSAA